jgi:small subunit ribosomal protein S1
MSDMFGDDFDSKGKKKNESDFASMFENSLGSVGKELRKGDRVRSEVLSIGKEEVFVSTGTIHDGVVLKIDLDPMNPVKVGDSMDLFVTQVKGQQIFLSPKPTSKNIAEDIEDAFDMMLPVEGKVTEVVNGGFRVNVLGHTAFCPISQMDIKRIEAPEEYLNKKFEFRITQYAEKGRKFVVSRRDLLKEERELGLEEFWTKIPAQFQIGKVVEGKVMNCASFGAFVEIYPGVQGLIPLSEMSFTRRVTRSDEIIKVGETVSVMVKDILTEQRKLTLSLKEAGTDPWSLVASSFPVGKVIAAKALRKENFGVIVQIQEGITALLPKSKSMDVADFNYDKIKVGDTLQVQISEVRPDERRMTVTPPRSDMDDSWTQFTGSKGSMGTMAEQFMKALQKPKK